jgi:hypothetical protein
MPHDLTHSNGLATPAPKAVTGSPALEAGAVFAQAPAALTPTPDGGPDPDLGPRWATTLAPEASARTLPASPFTEGAPRPVALDGAFGKAIRNGLLAAGLLLAPMATAEAGVPTEPNPIVEVATLQPGQSLLVAPGHPVDTNRLQGDRTHHYQVTAANGALAVTRLASDAAIRPAAITWKDMLGLAACAPLVLAAAFAMLNMVTFGVAADVTGEWARALGKKIYRLKQDLSAKLSPTAPAARPSGRDLHNRYS